MKNKEDVGIYPNLINQIDNETSKRGGEAIYNEIREWGHEGYDRVDTVAEITQG